MKLLLKRILFIIKYVFIIPLAIVFNFGYLFINIVDNISYEWDKLNVK